MRDKIAGVFTNLNMAENLKGSILFANLTSDSLLAFIHASNVHYMHKNKVIFIQGEKADYFYLIMSGWVKLYRETLNGSEAVVDVLSCGQIFGDISLEGHAVEDVTAQVVEDAKIISIPTHILREGIRKHHQLALNLLSMLSHQRRHQAREIEHLHTKNAAERIGCFLLRLCPLNQEEAITINLPYDKTLIASRLGMKPETFSRALGKLKAETNIHIAGSKVHIPVLHHLIRYSCANCSMGFPCNGKTITHNHYN